MSVAKVIEIISMSKKSFEDAVQQGVARAAESVSDVTGAWIKDQSVELRDGKIVGYKVTMKVTFIVREQAKAKPKAKAK